MAERPMRAMAAEQKLLGQPLSASAMKAAADCIEKEFTPISDMRASAEYRSQAIGQLLQRAWLDWSVQ
jgi:xanthine dehydrogenase small subunit